MQCNNCGFENMPGIEACGRCGSGLRVSVATDVHPPRARPWQKRLRRWLPLHSLFQLRDALADTRVASSEWLRGWSGLALPPASVLGRLLVPGWAQINNGQTLRGRLFLAAYLTLLLAGAVFWGTVPGSMLLGLAISVHVSATLDVLWHEGTTLRERLAGSILVSTLLLVAVYAPLNWLASGVAMPQTIQFTVAPFHDGDAVLVNQWSYLRSRPQPGQVVLFNNPNYRLDRDGPPHTRLVFVGNHIDRILARGGDHVVWEDGTLLVNGTPSPWQPLNPAALPKRLELTVPEHRYLIFPTSSPRVSANPSSATWQEMSCISEADILGRAYLRNQPLGRFWWIR
jgi:hypothetical protein